ncbi:MAG: hypothetical protein OXG24_09750 [Gammaproteobacteria bacterium]|nr:hypothetical protein [Gammaproteobacteria bacterium]
MRSFPPFVLAGLCLAIGFCASATPCPNSPGLRPSQEVRENCEEKIKESSIECQRFITDLEQVINPTAQQRFDWAVGLSGLLLHETSSERRNEMKKQIHEEFRKLHQEHPNDVQIIYKLYIYGDTDLKLQRQRRIAKLAPNCTRNNKWIVIELDRRTGHGRNRLEQDPNLLKELSSMIEQGFEHAESNWQKMYFGHLKYREYLLLNKREIADSFRSQIITELDPANFPFQDDTTNNGWGLLCGSMGYQFRFAEICLNAIDKALNEHPGLDRFDPEDAYFGVKQLTRELVGPTMGVLGRAPPRVHQVSFNPYTTSEGARILMRLRDVMDDVPNELRTDRFYSAYEQTLSRNPWEELVDHDFDQGLLIEADEIQ